MPSFDVANGETALTVGVGFAVYVVPLIDGTPAIGVGAAVGE
jgi:hypothetical protein